MTGKQVRELLETVKSLTAENKILADENVRLKQKLERMNELLLGAQRARFGQSSEKRGYALPGSEQTCIFNEAEQEQDQKAEEPTEKNAGCGSPAEEKAHKRGAYKGSSGKGNLSGLAG